MKRIFCSLAMIDHRVKKGYTERIKGKAHYNSCRREMLRTQTPSGPFPSSLLLLLPRLNTKTKFKKGQSVSPAFHWGLYRGMVEKALFFHLGL